MLDYPIGFPLRGTDPQTEINRLAIIDNADDILDVKTKTLFFDNFDVRFFAELGLPDIQGWTSSGTTIFSDNIFGVAKDSIKFEGINATTSSPLDGDFWDNVLTNGASYSGVMRIEETIVGSILSGMGFSVTNDPRPTSERGRFLVQIWEDGAHVNVQANGSGTIYVLDGTGGLPLVETNDFFTFETIIKPTPDAGVSFGEVSLEINGINIFISNFIKPSNDSVSDKIIIRKWAGSDNTTYALGNFGITAYKESSTKTLTAAEMSADARKLIIPGGKRDYKTIIPDGYPRNIGDTFTVLANNVGGTVTLETEDVNVPQTLFNGENSYTIDVPSVKEVIFVNTVDQGNVYLAPEHAHDERNFARIDVYLPSADIFTHTGLVADVPTKLLNFFPVIKTSNDFTLDATNLRYYFDRVGATDVWFHITGGTSFTTSALNLNIVAEMYKNGVPEDGLSVSTFIATGSDTRYIGITGVVKINHLDYLELMVTVSKDSDITISRYVVNVHEMVGAV